MKYICYHCTTEFVPKTKPSNKDKPFCSSSCSASHNNSIKPKRKRINNNHHCLTCNGAIKRSFNKYCSLKCQMTFQYNRRISLWLATGAVTYSNSSSAYIKRYLLEKQNSKCAICQIPNIWNNLPMIFVLDHISGDSTDNKFENLRLICSNCDSQLPTYKGRNKGNGRFSRKERYKQGKSF